MRSRVEHELWFAYTLGADGEVISFCVAGCEVCSRAQCSEYLVRRVADVGQFGKACAVS